MVKTLLNENKVLLSFQWGSHEEGRLYYLLCLQPMQG